MTAKQLTDSILQLAIQGKLVPQDPNDEPASKLLERIREEKRRLVKEGKLKKSILRESTIDENDIFYSIPESWLWCRLGDLIELISGRDLEPHQYNSEEKGVPYMTGASNFLDGELIINRWTEKPITISHLGDLLITCKGTIGAMAENKVGDIHIARQIMAIRPFLLYKPFLEMYLKTRVAELGRVAKSIIPGITREDISESPFPLPPFEEQRRIAIKFEKILPIIKEYGEAYEEATKMDADLPGMLKKSILQEAIMGKLGTQNSEDEPASVLMEQIREEKKRLVKESVLRKKDLEETPIEEEEEPFRVPESWGFVRLGEITYNHGQKTPTEDFSYIDIGSIDNKHQKLNDNENILKAKDAPSRARKIVKLGDVLYATVRPYLHNMCIIDRVFEKEPIASTGFAVMACVPGLYNKYLFYYLLSPIFDDYANDGDNAKGMAYPAINDKKLYNGVVPLPPLAEQHRIVEKIEALFDEIDNMTINKNIIETDIKETEE